MTVLAEDLLGPSAPPTYLAATGGNAVRREKGDRDGRGPPPPLPTDQVSGGRFPPHIWFQIVDSLTSDGKEEETRAMGREFLHSDLRFVSRHLYLVCMSHLRSHYLPRYLSRVRQRYSSDPWTDLAIARRETKVLDLFIALEVKISTSKYSSELLDSSESSDELFDIYQPRARLEDIIIEKGIQSGILLQHGQVSNQATTEIIANDISVSISSKQIQVLLPFLSSSSNGSSNKVVRRNILTIARSRREDTLEYLADCILQALQELQLEGFLDGNCSWYQLREQQQQVNSEQGNSSQPHSSSTTTPTTGKTKNRLSSWFKKT
ncbi:unnamed protein product [Sympodiomycopsis kandeliae]